MDGVIFNFDKGVKDGKVSHPEHLFQQSRYGFFANLEPIEGAIEAVNKLREQYEVWILTRPSIQNLSCYSDKALSIEKYFGKEFLERLIMCTDKSLVKGDYLIDDSILHGQKGFEGKLIEFEKEPYFGSWENVLKYFIK